MLVLPKRGSRAAAVIMVIALTSMTAQMLAQTEPAPSSVPAEFEPFGVRLTVPADWKRLGEGQPQVIGRWAVLKPDAADQASAIVTVELQPARGRTAEIFGKELAEKTRGTVDAEAELAGSRACRVTGDLGDAKNPKPFEALIARHEEYLYMINSVGSGAGIAHALAIGDLRGGLEFVPIKPPTGYLEPRGEPISVFSRFRIKPLATLRPSPEQRQNVIQLRTMNYRRNRPDLLVTMEVISVSTPIGPGGASLEEVGVQIARQAGAKDVQISWKDVPGTPRRIVSSTFTIPGRPLPLRLGLVQLSSKEVGMINFGLATPDDFDRALYQERCDAMLQSVEVMTAGSVSTAPATAPAPALSAPSAPAVP